MLTHIQASQTKMIDTGNAKSRPISFATEDYVYLQLTPVGTVSKYLVKLFDHLLENLGQTGSC